MSDEDESLYEPYRSFYTQDGQFVMCFRPDMDLDERKVLAEQAVRQRVEFDKLQCFLSYDYPHIRENVINDIANCLEHRVLATIKSQIGHDASESDAYYVGRTAKQAYQLFQEWYCGMDRLANYQSSFCDFHLFGDVIRRLAKRDLVVRTELGAFWYRPFFEREMNRRNLDADSYITS